MCDINTIYDCLGIPWELSKDQPFSTSTIYIGFEWNLETRTVSLSAPKASKYLESITNWLKRDKHTLQDVQSLYRKLLHTCAVIPQGRAYLTGFERMIKVCTPKPFLPHCPEKTITNDLAWWTHILTSNLASRPIHNPPLHVNIAAFSDASSSYGVGIVIGNHWRAWCLHPQWKTLHSK